PVPVAPRYGRSSGIRPPPTPVPRVSMTTYRAPRAARAFHSPIAAAFASLSIPTGNPCRACIRSRKSTPSSGMFTDATARPERWSIRDGSPKPSAVTSAPSRTCSTTRSSWSSRASDEEVSVSDSRRRSMEPSGATTAASVFVPPTSTPMTRGSKALGTIRRRMASPGGEKPYRLYRGGRVKGRVPTASPPGRPPRTPRPERDGNGRHRGPGPKPTARAARKVRWGREIGIAIVLVVLFFLVWGVLGYLVFRGGVSDANKRLPQTASTALTPDKGSLLSDPSAILLLGTDHSAAVSRSGDRHSDSITLLRTDPAHHRLYYLSIPRDLRVEIPGYGPSKVNAAFQIGGPRLAIRPVASYPDIPANHVIVVNF